MCGRRFVVGASSWFSADRRTIQAGRKVTNRAKVALHLVALANRIEAVMLRDIGLAALQAAKRRAEKSPRSSQLRQPQVKLGMTEQAFAAHQQTVRLVDDLRQAARECSASPIDRDRIIHLLERALDLNLFDVRINQSVIDCVLAFKPKDKQHTRRHLH